MADAILLLISRLAYALLGRRLFKYFDWSTLSRYSLTKNQSTINQQLISQPLDHLSTIDQPIGQHPTENSKSGKFRLPRNINLQSAKEGSHFPGMARRILSYSGSGWRSLWLILVGRWSLGRSQVIVGYCKSLIPHQCPPFTNNQPSHWPLPHIHAYWIY